MKFALKLDASLAAVVAAAVVVVANPVPQGESELSTCDEWYAYLVE